MSDRAEKTKQGPAFEAHGNASVRWLASLSFVAVIAAVVLKCDALGIQNEYVIHLRESILNHPVLWSVGTLIFLSFCLKSGKKSDQVPQVQGFCHEDFDHVRQVYRELIISGKDKGSSFSAYYQGHLVVNLWAGYADSEAKEPWGQDTVSMWYSTSKGVMGIVMAHLVDRGYLDYKARVCQYWPEFAQNGKDNITVEQLLSHQGGLAVIEAPYTLASQQDNPDELGRQLAQQRPLWEPGSRHGYHNVTLALYADQLVRRVDPHKRSLSQYFDEEIGRTFDIDFSFGLKRQDHYRKARQVNYFRNFWAYFPPWVLYKWIWAEMFDKNSISKKMKGNPTDWVSGNNPKFQEYECGSTHGFGTAEGVAKLYGILANGGTADGKCLLTKQTIEKLEKPISSGPDLAMRIPINWGLSGSVVHVEEGSGDSHPIMGCGGFGGQMALSDSFYKVGWSFLTNYLNVYHGFTIDERYQSLQDALYKCVRQKHDRIHLPLRLNWG